MAFRGRRKADIKRIQANSDVLNIARASVKKLGGKQIHKDLSCRYVKTNGNIDKMYVNFQHNQRLQ